MVLLLGCISVSYQAVAQLPDSPQPCRGAATCAYHAWHTGPSAPSKWESVIDPRDHVPPFAARDKSLYWLREEENRIAWTPTFLSAGFGQLTDGDPRYGSDSAAFGERLGAGAIRGASMRMFSDSLLPLLTHEDPRYFRKACGGIKERGLYAAERVFVNRRDDGSLGFNYSVTLGHLAGAALTPLYYPAPSANGEVVVQSWLLSLAGAAGGNLFLEFWPDARDKIFHHRHPARN